MCKTSQNLDCSTINFGSSRNLVESLLDGHFQNVRRDVFKLNYFIKNAILLNNNFI